MYQIKIHTLTQEIMSFTRRRFCFNCSLVMVFMLFLHAGFAQTDLAGIDALLTSRKAQLGNDFVLLVYKDGKPAYHKEGGEMKLDSPEPIGAASRWFTTALVMSFVDEGKLSLDDPIGKYLPSYESYSKGYITIRDCLAQTTGIESESKKLASMLKKSKFESLEQEVNNYAATKPIVNNPGKDFYYGDIGINIAGRVVEVISKRKTFAKLMQERIFKPIGMKKSSFVKEEGAESPAEGAVSTANEYIKFLQMLLAKGQANGKKVLTPASVDLIEHIQATQASVKYTPKLATGFKYGLGVWIEEADNNGQGTVISCPSFTGTWPYIDLCRNYACILLTKPLPGDPKKDLISQVKGEIESKIPAQCK